MRSSVRISLTFLVRLSIPSLSVVCLGLCPAAGGSFAIAAATAAVAACVEFWYCVPDEALSSAPECAEALIAFFTAGLARGMAGMILPLLGPVGGTLVCSLEAGAASADATSGFVSTGGRGAAAAAGGAVGGSTADGFETVEELGWEGVFTSIDV